MRAATANSGGNNSDGHERGPRRRRPSRAPKRTRAGGCAQRRHGHWSDHERESRRRASGACRDESEMPHHQYDRANCDAAAGLLKFIVRAALRGRPSSHSRSFGCSVKGSAPGAATWSRSDNRAPAVVTRCFQGEPASLQIRWTGRDLSARLPRTKGVPEPER